MNLNLPKKTTVWIALVLAAAGIVVYAIHLFAATIPFMQPLAFLLEFLAFLLLYLGLTMKGL